MRAKLKLLFTCRGDQDRGALESLIREEDARISAQAGSSVAITRAMRVPDEALQQIAAGAFDAAPPFDAMLELASEAGGPRALVPLVAGIASRLAPVIDVDRSAALAGNEIVILPGNHPLLVTIANRRLDRFDHEEFLRYWLDYHGPFAREHTPREVGMGYRQFHSDMAATEELLDRSGLAIGDFDGAAECHYRDADAVRLLMGMEEVVDEATEDEKEFVDHARCVTSVFAISGGSRGHELG